jgi:RHS repeat-associated protein
MRFASKAALALRTAVTRAVSSLLSETAPSPQKSAFEGLEARRMMSRAQGIDVSHFQGTINWTSVAGAGKTFAFQKSTEGVGYADPTLAANMSGGKAAGLLMGVYHRATPSTTAGDAVNEANYFVSQAAAYIAPGYMRPAVDLSVGSAMGITALSTWVNTFVDSVQAATGIEPIIYTNNDIATNYLNSSVADHDLWIARWSTAFGTPTADTSSPPAGVWDGNGRTWDFWQYSTTGTLAGISGSVNLDVFPGDTTALQAIMGIPASPLNANITIAATSASTVSAGQTYSISRTISGPDASQVTAWTVVWGDGIIETFPVTQAVADHEYDHGDSDYTIYAVAGDQFSNELVATVTETHPVIALSGSGTVNENSSYQLTVAISNLASLLAGDSTLAMEVDWGDGTSQDIDHGTLASSGGTLTLPHTFAGGTSEPVITAVLHRLGADPRSDPFVVAIHPVAPTTPASVSVDDSTLQLTWVDASQAEIGYAIEQVITGGLWERLEVVSANTTEFFLNGLGEGVSSTYRIVALGAAADTAESSSVVGTTKVAPAFNASSTDASDSDVDLEWENESAFELGFRIEQLTTSGTWDFVKTVSPNVTQSTITGLSADTEYTFRIVAYGAAGDAALAPRITVRTDRTGLLPGTPSDLGASVVSTTRIDLAWQDNATDETSYVVERREAGADDWDLVATLTGADHESYSDTSVAANKTYYYRVIAVSSVGRSDPAEVGTATTSLAAPTLLVAQATASGDIRLTWNDQSPNELGFNIYGTSDNGATRTFITSTSAQDGTSVGSMVVGDLAAGISYSFLVTAFTDDLETAATNVATASATPQYVDVIPPSSARFDQAMSIVVNPVNIPGTLSWDIDWGDGSSDVDAPAFDNGDGTFTFGHTYTANGEFIPRWTLIVVTARSNSGEWISNPYSLIVTPQFDIISAPKTREKIIKLFSDIYNTVRFEPYGGAKKGPNATKATKAGNDWDQAWLLKAQIEHLVGKFNEDGITPTTELRSDIFSIERSLVENWLGFAPAVTTQQKNDTKAAVLKLLTLMAHQSQSAASEPDDATDNAIADPSWFVDGSGSERYKFRFAYVAVSIPDINFGSVADPVCFMPAWKFEDRHAGVAAIGSSSGKTFSQDDYIAQSAESPADWYASELSKYLRTHTTAGKFDYVGQISLADIGRSGAIKQKVFKATPGSTPDGWVKIASGEGFTDLDGDTSTFKRRQPRVVFRIAYPDTDVHIFDEPNITTTLTVAELGTKPPVLRYDAVASDATLVDVVLYYGDSGTLKRTLARLRKVIVSTTVLGDKFRLDVSTSEGKIAWPEYDAFPKDYPWINHTITRSYALKPGTPIAILVSGDQMTPDAVAKQWAVLSNLADGYATQDVGDITDELNTTYQTELVRLAAMNYQMRVMQDADRLADMLGVISVHSVGSGVVTGVVDDDIVREAKLNNPYIFYDANIAAGLRFDMKGLTEGVDISLRNATSAGQALLVSTVAQRTFSAFGEGASAESFRVQQYYQVHNLNGSWIENAALEEVTNTEAVSTVKGFIWAQRQSTAFYKLKQVGTTITKDGASFNVSSLDVPLKTEERISAVLGEYSNDPSVQAYVYVPNSEVVLGNWHGGVFTIEYYRYGLLFGHGNVIVDPTGSYAGSAIVQSNPVKFVETRPNETPSNAGTINRLGDPVNMANGSLAHDEADITIPLPGLNFSITRHYESAFGSDLGLGIGWSFAYGDVLSIDSTQKRATWTTAGGEQYTFVLNGGTYSKPSGLFGTFTHANQLYSYLDTDGKTYTFEGADTSGRKRLLRIDDRNGNRLSLEYSGSNGQNRRFKYQAKGETGQRTVADWVETLSGTGNSKTVKITDSTGRVFTYSLAKRLGKWQLDSYLSPNYGSTQYDYVKSIYEYFPAGSGQARAKAGLLKSIKRVVGDPTTNHGNFRAYHTYDYYPNRRVLSTSEQALDGSTWYARGTEYFTHNLFTSAVLENEDYPSYIHGASHIDQNGNVLQQTYNIAGLLIRTLNADNSIVEQGWKEYGTSPADPTSRTYLLKFRRNEVGLADAYTYDSSNGMVTSQRLGMYAYTGTATDSPKGGTLSTTTYVNIGKAWLPDVVRVNEERQTKYTYDAKGNVASIVDAVGNKTTFERYSLSGLLEKMVRPKGNVAGASAATKADYTEEYTHDDKTGLLTSVKRPLVAGGSAEIVSSSTYDTLGRGTPLTTTVGKNVTLDGLYHQRAVVTTYSYDVLNRQRKVEVAQADAQNRTYTYFDYLDDLVTWTEVKVKSLSTGTINQITTSSYDLGGRQVKRVTPDGNVVTSEYDAFGNLTGSVDYLGRTAVFVYDERNRQAQSIAPDRGFTYTVFDGLNRVVSVSTPRAGVSDYGLDSVARSVNVYDRAGYLSTVTDASDQFVTMKYKASDSGVYQYAELEETNVYDPAWNALSGSNVGPWKRTLNTAIDRLGRVTETRSTDGVVTSTAFDPNGNTITTTRYNVDQYPTQFMDRNQLTLGSMPAKYRRSTYTTFDVADRPIAVTDPARQTTRMFYDVAGHVVDVIDPRGVGVLPDTLGVPIVNQSTLASSYPAKYRTSNEYDSVGRLIITYLPAVETQGAADRNYKQFGYYRNGDLAQTTDARQKVTFYDYKYAEGISATWASSDGVSHVTITDRDQVGQVKSTTQWLAPLGSEFSANLSPGSSSYAVNKTQYEYDEVGRSTKVTRQSVGGLAAVQESHYNAAGDLTEQTDSVSGLKKYDYDALHRVVGVENYATAGFSTSGIALAAKTRSTYIHGDLFTLEQYRTANDRYITKFDYDRAGRQIAQMSDASPNTQPDAADKIWAKSYSSLGTLLSSSDYTVRGSTGVKDVVITSYGYDSVNRLTSVAGDDAADGMTGTKGSRTEYQYDAAGNQTDVVVFADGTGASGTNYTFSQNAFDGRNRLISSVQTDQAGLGLRSDPASTRYKYDAADNLVRETDPDLAGGTTNGNSVAYTYDDLGRKKSETRWVYLNGSNQEARVARLYSYDKIKSGDSSRSVTTVEDFHSVDATTGARISNVYGLTTDFEYDALGRIAVERWYSAPGGTLTKTLGFEYDKADRQLWGDSVYTGSGDTTHDFARVYDPAGRLQSETQAENLNSVIFTLTYADYDLAGNANRLEVKRGSTVDSTQRFTFNYLNQLTDVRLFTGAATTGGHRVALSRYQDGAISAVTPHNDVTPTSTGTAVTRAKMVYGRDGAGQLSSITGTAARFDYKYDRLGRIQEMMTDGQTATKKTYQYWADNQIKQENSATFAYDDNYNRTDSSRATGSGNRQKSDSAWTYEYDERGNEVKKISKGSAGRWEYSYDHRNRLIGAKQYSATTGGTKSHDVVYSYDAANRRVEKKDDTNSNTSVWETQERYAVNGVNAVLVTNLTGAFSARYMFGDAPDEVLAEELSINEGFRWLVTDHQGSVRRVLKADGTTMRSVNYDAFGNVAASTATDAGKLPRFMYTGQQFDNETGLGFFDARYYAADSARFISADVTGEGTNDFAYVFNNPLNLTDPTGLSAFGANSGGQAVTSLKGPLSDENGRPLQFADADANSSAIGRAVTTRPAEEPESAWSKFWHLRTFKEVIGPKIYKDTVKGFYDARDYWIVSDIMKYSPNDPHLEDYLNIGSAAGRDHFSLGSPFQGLAISKGFRGDTEAELGFDANSGFYAKGSWSPGDTFRKAMYTPSKNAGPEQLKAQMKQFEIAKNYNIGLSVGYKYSEGDGGQFDSEFGVGYKNFGVSSGLSLPLRTQFNAPVAGMNLKLTLAPENLQYSRAADYFTGRIDIPSRNYLSFGPAKVAQAQGVASSGQRTGASLGMFAPGAAVSYRVSPLFGLDPSFVPYATSAPSASVGWYAYARSQGDDQSGTVVGGGISFSR